MQIFFFHFPKRIQHDKGWAMPVKSYFYSLRSPGSLPHLVSGLRTCWTDTASSTHGCTRVAQWCSGWLDSSTLKVTWQLWDRRSHALTRAGRLTPWCWIMKSQGWWRKTWPMDLQKVRGLLCNYSALLLSLINFSHSSSRRSRWGVYYEFKVWSMFCIALLY